MFNFTTRLRKRKLMTLPLLTSITHNLIFLTRHTRKLMTTQNMTDDRSGWMTKARMPLRQRRRNAGEDPGYRRRLQPVETMTEAPTKKYVPRVPILYKK